MRRVGVGPDDARDRRLALSALTKIAGVSLLVLLLVALVVWKAFDPCFVKRSVRFDPAPAYSFFCSIEGP
jgi:hypothetical protein